MPADIVIRGGTVVDGSGSPGRVADVAVAGGVISEIGPDLQGERVLDASGCVVAPGFIDIHTHYDAQVFWDPALRPSSYQGVTTVVAGNCGFTIAPTRPEHHDVIVRTLENVEDMDAASLTAGIVWEFQTYPEYLELVRSRGTEINFTAYVGHSSVRLYAMGDAAYERAATPEEIDAMCRARHRGDRRRSGRVLHELRVHPPRRRRQASAESVCRARRGRRAVHGGRQDRQGRGTGDGRRTVLVRRHVRAGRRASGGRSRTRCSRRPTGGTTRSSRSTKRPWSAGRGSTRRSPRGR